MAGGRGEVVVVPALDYALGAGAFGVPAVLVRAPREVVSQFCMTIRGPRQWLIKYGHILTELHHSSGVSTPSKPSYDALGVAWPPCYVLLHEH